MNKKILIAYYSRAGENYVSGSIVDLAVGNAKTIAQKISSLLPNADLFEIEPCVGYPKNYSECTRVAKKELKENARPALTRPQKGLMSITRYYSSILTGGQPCPCVFGHFLRSKHATLT